MFLPPTSLQSGDLQAEHAAGGVSPPQQASLNSLLHITFIILSADSCERFGSGLERISSAFIIVTSQVAGSRHWGGGGGPGGERQSNIKTE